MNQGTAGVQQYMHFPGRWLLIVVITSRVPLGPSFPQDGHDHNNPINMWPSHSQCTALVGSVQMETVDMAASLDCYCEKKLGKLILKAQRGNILVAKFKIWFVILMFALILLQQWTDWLLCHMAFSFLFRVSFSPKTLTAHTMTMWSSLFIE